jgi:hypothetical protein
MATRSFQNTNVVILFLAVCSLFRLTPVVAQPSSGDILVPITAKFTVSKKKAKHHPYRLQTIVKGDSLHVVGFGVHKMHRSLKMLKFSLGKGKVSRENLERSAVISLDSVYEFLKARQSNLSYKVPPLAEYERLKTNFISGRTASPYFSNQWITLARISGGHDPNLVFTTRGFLRTHHSYTVDRVPGAIAYELPSTDVYLCRPPDIQFFNLRKLQGYGVDKIRYVSYNTTARIIVRKAFEVYFPHNETIPDAKGLQHVVDYLEQNNYVILNAQLEGGCSIEGEIKRNTYLQEERARVLQRALHKYADEFLKKDTVLFTNSFRQFRDLIKTTKFQKLDTLSDERLLDMVNTSDALRLELEEILTLQRKASLKLVVAKRLSKIEQDEKFIDDLNKAASVYFAPKNVKPDAEHRIMGMIEKLFNDRVAEKFTHEELQQIITQSTAPDFLQLFFGYHILHQYENKLWPKEKTWQQMWRDYELKKWLDAAEKSALNIFQNSYDATQRTKLLKMLVDFQAYRYEFTGLGIIDVNELCQIPYPERNEFLGLILNQYAFLYEAASHGVPYLLSDSTIARVSVPCIPTAHATSLPARDSITDTDRYLDNILSVNRTTTYSLVGNKLVLEKSFDNSQKGAYYYLLKQFYVKKNQAALSHVEYENDRTAVTLNAFNLWHLIVQNVRVWDPFENYFYDIDVQLDEMEKLVGLLKQSDKGLCQAQVNQLYLDYHLKVLYYLERFAEPGNPKHTKYADASLKFISSYYKARAATVNPRLSLHIAKQFNIFNWLPGSQCGAWHGFDLLNTIAKQRLLSDEEFKLYAHYLKMYNPQMRKLSPVTIDKDKILALWNQPY